MSDATQRISELERLLSAFPAPSQAKPSEILRAYVTAVALYPTDDLIEAVNRFLVGTIPDHNPAFAPSAPQLASAVRGLRDARIQRSLDHKAAVRQIEEREVHKPGTSETRGEFVKRIMAESPQFAPEPEETAEVAAKRKADTDAYLKRHDERWGLTTRTDEEVRQMLRI